MRQIENRRLAVVDSRKQNPLSAMESNYASRYANIIVVTKKAERVRPGASGLVRRDTYADAQSAALAGKVTGSGPANRQSYKWSDYSKEKRKMTIGIYQYNYFLFSSVRFFFKKNSYSAPPPTPNAAPTATPAATFPTAAPIAVPIPAPRTVINPILPAVALSESELRDILASKKSKT
jgi:hypothetical protein